MNMHEVNKFASNDLKNKRQLYSE